MAVLIFLMSMLLVTSLSKQLQRKGSSQLAIEGLRRWEVTVAELKASAPLRSE